MEYSVVTMEFSPRLFSRVRGAVWKIKFDLIREYPVVTMEFSPRLFLRVGGALWKIKYV